MPKNEPGCDGPGILPSLKPSRESLLLASILVAGLVLRISAMAGRGLIDDEVAIALALEHGYGELVRSFGGQVTQPLYLLLAKTSQELLANLIGTEAALRLPSLVFGVLGILLVARLARRMFGPGPGLWAALLLAVQPFHLFYSQMAVGYAVAGTLSLGSMLAFLRLADTRGRSGVAFYAGVTAAAIYCHLGCLGVVLSQVLALPLLARGATRAELTRILAAVAIGGSVGLLLYLPVLSSVLAFRKEWSEGEGHLPAAMVPFVLTAFAGGAGLRIYAMLCLAVAGLAVGSARPEGRRGVAVLLLWPVGVFAFYLLNGAAHPPWAFARFFYVALPAVVVATAVGVDALSRTLVSGRSGWRKAPAGAALLLFAAAVLSRTAVVAWGDKGTPWPALMAHLRTRVPPDALLISMPMRFNAFKGFYHPRAEGVPEHTYYFRDPLASVPLDRPVVFLVDLVPFDDPAWGADFTLTRFGDTTVLQRSDGAAGEKRALRDLERVTHEVLAYINSRPAPSDWIYWKVDPEHQSLFDKRRLNRQYSVLLEMAQRRLTGRRAGEREFQIQDPYPPFWGLLAPR